MIPYRKSLPFLLTVLLAGCAGRTPQPENGGEPPPEVKAAAAPAVEKERADVPDPAPVSRGGVRYQAVLWGRARNLPQNGGYIAAVDEKTSQEQWLAKIYDAPPDDGKEQDKLDVFITRIEFDTDPRFLLVTNERGAVFKLDLQTQSVIAAAKP